MTTTFTPENSALLLIDHQVGTMQLIKNIDVEQAKRMSLALAKTARILGIPTVLTSSQEDRLQGPLLHGAEGHSAGCLREARQARRHRQRLDRRQLQGGCRGDGAQEPDHGRRDDRSSASSSRRSTRLTEGYNVQAVMDASGSPYELSEDMSRRRMQDAGVVLTATNTMIAELAQNWGTPQGQQLIQLLFTEVLPPIQVVTGAALARSQRVQTMTLDAIKSISPDTHLVRDHGPFRLRRSTRDHAGADGRWWFRRARPHRSCPAAARPRRQDARASQR